ncbi:hypothetical protein AVEN_110273-1 [Araneus ventricosus]|uniref:Major facilitator superfamily associated domain-containing protein n=1 Tax=Araneus ventricosus TaxID=182803 RepID=A0A4Y2DP92_ARAVE|nr:hypothetical protein AVEN_110273-1 [Araneus ventricosus]
MRYFFKIWLWASLLTLHFEKKRVTAMGISMTGSGFGAFAFGPLMEWLISYNHYWKGATLIATGILLHCFILSFFYRVFPSFDETNRTADSSPDSNFSLQQACNKFDMTRVQA